MTNRRKLKKQLSQLKSLKNTLPRLIDCSLAYGDNYFTEEAYARIEKDIEILEQRILNIDKHENN